MGQKTVRWVALLTAVGLAVGAAARAGASTKSDSVVKVTATADKPGADGKQVIHIRLAIDPGWHTYANPIGTDVGVPTSVTVAGKGAGDVQVHYPAGKTVKDSGGDYYVYEGDTTIDATVRRSKDDSPLKVKVKIQACDATKCLVPATVEVSVP
ncbi:MAG TPA: protein-disulfide reductase DsbD N-terminal domain-containing protein [Gemmataceae bacterium]|nr:protein-disulfide reductase DsbD N-terminal domain-containing protein [Gemmataceae bacterium]